MSGDLDRDLVAAAALALQVHAVRERLSLRLLDGAIILVDASPGDLAELSSGLGLEVAAGPHHALVVDGALLTGDRLLELQL